ncbi:MAG: Rpn family recombination-promoting nuclease/putative transposase [Gammaproteobacteria bacterium]|nr:Rpn family recombination-promoting nuclease/putative transposase [Gammaproteobacteria bacterium]
MNSASPLPPAFPHDAAYKAMYGHPEAIFGLRPYLAAPNGPLNRVTLDALDFGRIEKLPTEWVTRDFRRRHGDQVWRVPFRSADGTVVWLILLLEFQSEADRGMTLRVLRYVWELWRDMEVQGALLPDAARPLTLPVVIHNGAIPWRAPRQLVDWTLGGLTGGVREDLLPLQASVGLHVVDFASHREDDLIHGNLTSLQIGFENAGPSDFARLVPALADLPSASLRRTAYDWVRLRARHYFGMELEALEDTDMSVSVFRSRLDENMKRATEAWFADGLKAGVEQGLEQGLERGLEQQRSLLGRQAAAKFGTETAARLTPLLAEASDWSTLAELGEVLLAAGDESQLLARTKAVVAFSQQRTD